MMNYHSQILMTEIKVRFRDLDAMGHVNNAVYFTYMEIARSHFLIGLLNLTNPLKLPVIIADASCTFKASARFGDTIRVTVTVTRIGNKSFELSYEMSNQESQSIASGRTVMVTYDYINHLAMMIPEKMRKSLELYHAL